MKKKILILASNPRADLDLGYEIHALKNIIEDSENLQEFDVVINDAISPSNIQNLFLEHEPRIVHFCGHGSGENGLVFADSSGKEQLVSTQALSNLFKEFDDTIECVLLNACYSEVQADEIAKYINYAIGMNQAIADDAAIFFAKGFYQALGKGKQIRQCFRLGKNAIELELSKLSGHTRKFEVLDLEECELIPEHLKPIIEIKSILTLFAEDIAREKYIQDNQEDFNLGRREQATLSKKEYLFRKILLNKVRDSWINGVLENSLHTKALLELKIEERANLVHNPFSQYQELPVDPNSSYEWLNATDIFEQMGDGRTLLILGEPGSGKTIALLKLAKRFIEKAEKNLSLPIPVVFNLSSWATKRKSINEWLVIELKEKYQLSKSLAKQWIEQEQLLLLLDGLDEVKQEHRSDCTKAINQFLNSHGITEVVICSRFHEYESLSKKLQLRNAIYIQPLTSEHIDWYFKDTGDQLYGLKTLLKNDTEIEEFAKTPLIFNVMTITYKNYSSQKILKELKVKDKRYERLFDNYIYEVFKPSDDFQINKKKYIKWMNFIAKKMVCESKSVFLIESISQTDYKANIIHKRRYIFVIAFVGFLIGCIATSNSLHFIHEVTVSSTIKSIYKDTMGLYPSAANSIVGGIISSCFFISFIFLETKSTNLDTFDLIEKALPKVIVITLVLILYSFLYIVIALLSSKTGNRVFGILAYSFLATIILDPLLKLLTENINIDFLYADKNKNFKPNEGTWLSFKNAIILGLIGCLVATMISFSFIGILTLLYKLNLSNYLLISFFSPLMIYLFLFLGFGGFLLSGFFSIQHFIIRCILYINKYSPWNYSRFLDFTTKYLITQKVGGGYIFVHRMLMEHFAKMKIDK